MLLSYVELVKLVQDGVINAPLGNINSTSIDVTLSNHILVESTTQNFNKVVNLANKESIKTDDIFMDEKGWIAKPGRFFLASTNEIFNLPSTISCAFMLKSTMARNGLECLKDSFRFPELSRNGLQHLNAGWCDAGWHGSTLTMEFVNMTEHHQLMIAPGMKCGQVVFFKHTAVPIEKSYAARGQYNNQQITTASRGLR